MRVAPGQPALADPTDRRTLRSRQVLMDALGELLKKKEFDEVSIQEIADAANLTRATFYLHYPDKAALLQAMTAARLGAMLEKRGIASSTCEGGLEALVLGVCDYLAKSSGCPNSLRKMPLERSVIPVVEGIFRDGARQRGLPPGVDPDIFATAIAWAICGAASRWAQTPGRGPAEEMAGVIASLVRPLLDSVATTASQCR